MRDTASSTQHREQGDKGCSTKNDRTEGLDQVVRKNANDSISSLHQTHKSCHNGNACPRAKPDQRDCNEQKRDTARSSIHGIDISATKRSQ